jgi:hypothetical protein
MLAPRQLLSSKSSLECGKTDKRIFVLSQFNGWSFIEIKFPWRSFYFEGWTGIVASSPFFLGNYSIDECKEISSHRLRKFNGSEHEQIVVPEVSITRDLFLWSTIESTMSRTWLEIRRITCFQCIAKTIDIVHDLTVYLPHSVSLTAS